MTTADIIGVGSFTAGAHSSDSWADFGFDVQALTAYGTAGADTLVGTTQSDTFFSSLGADIINGSNTGTFEGVDTIDYSGSNAGVTVYMNSTTAGIGGHAEGDIISNMRYVTGSDFDDIIFSGRNSLDLTLGGEGNDTLYLGILNGNIFGENGNDTIIMDTSYGFLSNRSTRTLSGGDGFDTLRIESDNDTTFELSMPSSDNLDDIERFEVNVLADNVSLTASFQDSAYFFLDGSS